MGQSLLLHWIYTEAARRFSEDKGMKYLMELPGHRQLAEAIKESNAPVITIDGRVKRREARAGVKPT